MIPNKRLTDSLVRHKILALGYARHVANRVIAFLDATEPRIRRELLDIFGSGATGSRVASRLRRAEALLSRIRGVGWSRATDEVTKMIAALALGEPEHLSKASDVNLKTPKSTTLLSRAKGALVGGHTVKDWFASMRSGDIRRMIGQLRIGIFAGEDVGKVLKRITGRLSSVANAAKNSVRTIVSTAVGSVINTVRRTLIDLNPGTFGHELWVSILDGATTAGCRRLDGTMFRAGEGIQPGYHLGCRSERIPVLDEGGEYDVGTYSAWIGTQSDSFQRYAGMSQFSANDLKPLTLDKMRRMDAQK